MATPSLPPIVFADADTSLQVFHQAFHVNSTVLKIHSEFFRKFLDSPDNKSSASASAAGVFKYEWVTEVDIDGNGWVLTAKEKSSPQTQAKHFKGKPTDQIYAFHVMLQALHCQPITITTVEQLCRVTQLSDFYRVLPAVSNALHGVFYGNAELVESIPKNCVALLEASYKLRNKLLFRECFVHIMGPTNKPKYLELRDEGLKRLCISARQHVQDQLHELHLEILRLELMDPYVFAPKMLKLKSTGTHTFLVGQKILQPLYFRSIFSNALPTSPNSGSNIENLFKKILQSKLVLDRSGVQAGEGAYKDSFLCFELSDQELPWNVNETVW